MRILIFERLKSARPKNYLETVMDDPLVEEARQAGQKYIASFQGDDKAMLADLRKRAKASGSRLVQLPPKKPLAKTAHR